MHRCGRLVFCFPPSEYRLLVSLVSQILIFVILDLSSMFLLVTSPLTSVKGFFPSLNS